MHLWRLARKAFAKKPLSGEGGLYASGRWHTAPRLVVYASGSLALAALELLVHLDADLAPPDLVAIEIDVPSGVSIARWTVAQMPRSWRRYPAPHSIQQMGDTWLDEQETAVLCVPSVIVPNEMNYVVNPLHPDAAHITVVAKKPFIFDQRLIRKDARS